MVATKDTIIIPSTFKRKPALAICGTLIKPDPKTIAFGGVATGSIKAHEAANVAPTISKYGCTPSITAVGANIGRSMAVVAKLDVISVKKFTAVITTSRIINSEEPLS